MQFRILFAGLAALTIAAIVPARAAAVTVSGRVTNSAGEPIVSVQVAFVVFGTSTTAATAITSATGTYTVAVNAGTYDVHLTPPPDGVYAPQTLPGRSIVSDTLLDFALIATTTAGLQYGGHVVDRSGAAMGSGINARLCPVGGGSCFFGTVDAGGDFVIDAPAGSYNLELQSSAALPNRPQSFLVRRALTLAVDTNETIMLENRTLSGQVIGPLGPVATTAISASTNVSFGAFSGSSSGSAIADSGGNFQVTLFAGFANVSGVPPQSSGVGQGSTNADLTTDAFVPLTLPAAVTYSGQVVDRNGIGLTLVQQLTLCGNGPCVQALTGPTGSFTLSVAPGDYTLYLSGSFNAAPSASYNVSRGVTLTQNTLDTIQIPNRTLSGVLRNAGGNPLPDLIAQTNFSGVAFDGFFGSANADIVADGSGQYQLPILPGDGTLSVVPQAGQSVGTANVPLIVTADGSLDITLPQLFSLQVRVLNRSGNPVAALAYTCPQGGQCGSWVPTDSQGYVTLEAGVGLHSVHLFSFAPPIGSFSAAYSFDLPAQNSTQIITLQNRQLTGTVVDPDGIPVAGVETTAALSVSNDGSGNSWSSTTSATTDANGNFTMEVLRGAGSIVGTPPVLTGLVPFTVQGVVVDGDLVQGLFLQFVTEQVGAPVTAGGTVTTDSEADGATESDPIETTITSPNGGTVTISEAPVALSPPGHFTFLTQQIDISAPPATSVNPLVIVFRIDATRIPADKNETNLQVLRNGYPVPNCTGAAGTASPNPCISLRQRLPDGDVSLTVLTSEASLWHVGFGDQPCFSDAECDDGVSCTEDLCINDFCALVPHDEMCSNGVPCDGVEHCYQDTGCGPGTPVVCVDDGNYCTEDICEPTTGLCGIPTICPDDGNPCFDDVCDPYSGFCGVANTGPCDDGSTCTAGDQCNLYYWGACAGTLTDLDDAVCEVDRFAATPPCTPLDSKLQIKIEKRMTAAHRRLENAALSNDPRKIGKAINSTAKKLYRILSIAYRYETTQRITPECRLALEQRIYSLVGMMSGIQYQ